MPYEITRTELVWPGKYDENGKPRESDRVSLPFQVIERVNESRATREVTKARGLTLFDIWEGDSAETFEDGWRNKLIWGDNKLVMSSLLNQFAGKVDLIYIDPPFATGSDFAFTVSVGDGDTELVKEQSLIEEKAYRDTWGNGLASWLDMIHERLLLARDLLSPLGAIYVHVDYRVAFHLRVLMDEVFGVECFQNDVVWHYSGWNRHGQRYFNRRHDLILYYSRGPDPAFNSYAIPWGSAEEYVRVRKQKILVDDAGKEYVLSDAGGGERVKRFLAEAIADGKPADDVWNLDKINNSSKEAVGYETQKPESLLERIIAASSKPGDLVADFFSGSGTTAVVAEKAGRRWVAADLGRFAIHTTRKRLLGIDRCKPFEVLNLGKYERRYWQVATFGEDLDDDGVVSLYEYVAFVLKLYHASPAAGMQHLHGRKARAFVHVGAVDSPVTIDEIAACIEECVALKAKELHVLGWEWEMGLHDPMADEAAARGVHLLLRQIPRELMEQQAAVRGDVEFFELAYLDVAIAPTRRKLEVVAKLKNFVIPNPELVPEEVRDKVRKWSDYVDYWAVDWNFSDDTFHQGWVTYRTRQDRSLDLESDAHAYERPGEYAVMVKVIDIFGNDTSKIYKIKVG